MVLTRLGLALLIGLTGFWFWNHVMAVTADARRLTLILSIILLGILITAVTTVIYWFAYRSFRHLFTRLTGIIQRRRKA